MIKYSVILCFILLPLMAQDRWAIIIGITEYPYWLGKLPILSSPAKDAQIIKHSLLSPECEFAEQKVFTLINQQAQKDNINAALDCIQQNAKPGDSLIFIFIGHGFFREDRYFLLCYDGNSDDVAASNISLDSLANRLESLPCQKIAFFLDCHRSKESLGYSWKSCVDWMTKLALHKELATFWASSFQEIAKDRGLFAYFVGRALMGNYYLNQTPDENTDNYITCGEMMQHIQQSLRFSGFGQFPIVYGNSSIVLCSPIYQSPHVVLLPADCFRIQDIPDENIVQNKNDPTTHYPASIPSPKHSSPTIHADKISVHFTGTVHFHQPIVSVNIGSRVTHIYSKLTPILSPVRYTYEFSCFTRMSSETPDVEFCVREVSGKEHRVYVEIPWQYMGWYGEWMPKHMIRGNQKGLYIWKKDQSEMVYIPGGSIVCGVSVSQMQDILAELTELQKYHRQLQAWYEQDLECRKLLANSIEDSNQAVRSLSHKIQSLYQKTSILDKVQRRVAPQPQEDIPTPSLGNTDFQYLQRSQEILSQSQKDISHLMQQREEMIQIITYLDYILAYSKEYTQYYFPIRTEIKGFYIDRYETTNSQYRFFCEATGRAYPMPPPWDENYIFQDNMPVIAVSWEDSSAYMLWSGKKLPLVRQWEYAGYSMHKTLYPWGEEPPTLSRVNANVPPSLEEEHPQLALPTLQPMLVHTMPQGTIFHWIGNVAEWSRNLAWNPTSNNFPGKDEYRILKGGSFQNSSVLLFPHFNMGFPSTTRRYDVGFRGIVED